MVTRVNRDAWTSSARTPMYYPDAVTLAPDVSVPDLLSRIDHSPGCSIKDSFASIELTEYGFVVLFEAQWMVRASQAPPLTGSSLSWDLVRDPGAFRAWESAWRGDDGPTGVLRPSLLNNDSIAVLATCRGDRVVAGAVVNRSAAVAGLSNYFSDPAVDAQDGWSGCVSFAAGLWKALPLIGYESGARLATAQRAGFDPAGALRVWLLPG